MLDTNYVQVLCATIYEGKIICGCQYGLLVIWNITSVMASGNKITIQYFPVTRYKNLFIDFICLYIFGKGVPETYKQSSSRKPCIENCTPSFSRGTSSEFSLEGDVPPSFPGWTVPLPLQPPLDIYNSPIIFYLVRLKSTQVYLYRPLKETPVFYSSFKYLPTDYR